LLSTLSFSGIRISWLKCGGALHKKRSFYMIEVTEYMRKAYCAVMDGLCPECNKPLEVKGDGLLHEDGNLYWFCSSCGYDGSPYDKCCGAASVGLVNHEIRIPSFS
jgi:hypothetical protein